MEKLGKIRDYTEKMREIGYIPIAFIPDNTREGKEELARILGEIAFNIGDRKRGYKISIAYSEDFDFSSRPDREGHIVYSCDEHKKKEAGICAIPLKKGILVVL